MKRKRTLIITDDGSSTIFDSITGDHYHSTHGAEQEARHVFIEMGLIKCLEQKNELQILEVGLGTGLNLILTVEHSLNRSEIKISYTGLEPFPVVKEHYSLLSFKSLKNEEIQKIFNRIHESEFNKEIHLTPSFLFEKKEIKLKEFKTEKSYDLIYYDAFGPRYQPEMWGIESVERIYSLMKPNACLVTYCAQGAFRRNLEALGLKVERLPGPPGKREMIRAFRT